MTKTAQVFEELNDDIRDDKLRHTIESIIADYQDEIRFHVMLLDKSSAKKRLKLYDLIHEKVGEVDRLKRQLKVIKAKMFFKKIWKAI
jgi:hypothetical protein